MGKKGEGRRLTSTKTITGASRVETTHGHGDNQHALLHGSSAGRYSVQHQGHSRVSGASMSAGVTGADSQPHISSSSSSSPFAG